MLATPARIVLDRVKDLNVETKFASVSVVSLVEALLSPGTITHAALASISSRVLTGSRKTAWAVLTSGDPDIENEEDLLRRFSLRGDDV